jgi:hypothetical protein
MKYIYHIEKFENVEHLKRKRKIIKKNHIPIVYLLYFLIIFAFTKLGLCYVYVLKFPQCPWYL